MSAFIEKIPTPVKITTAIITPVILTFIAFYIYGIQIQKAEQIYPNITIAGVDVSGLTRMEAMMELDIHDYEERAANSSVSIIFPDESVLNITGNDINLHHNAHEIITEAYMIGRENGVIRNTIAYLKRNNADEITFDIGFTPDTDQLSSLISNFTEAYNINLAASTPVIHTDHVTFTRGAGSVSADANKIYELVYNGIYESLESEEAVEIIYLLPESLISQDIIDLQSRLFVQMVSAEFDSSTNMATESAIGIDIDMVAAAKLIVDIKSGESVSFPIIFTHPEYSEEYLNSLLFRDLIGQRTTWVHGAESRVSNINLASEAIHGLVLMPEEEFSFNGTVGQRTVEGGYRYAPAIVNDEPVSTIGGGICQVSSTIYAAIRPSDLLVTEQRPHRNPVPYLAHGWDATIFWPYIDFKFVNNTNYPILIEVELDNRYLTATISGTIIDDFPRVAGWND